MNPVTISIDVISDVACPWCYIGKHNLYTALRGMPEVRAQVRWLPYFLDPQTTETGAPYRPYLEQKFGGSAQLEAVWARVTEAGKQAGIAFAFDRIAWRANTLKAHRLIHRAQQRGNAEAWVEQLFAAHFTRGEHIADIEVLAGMAAMCGDEPDAVRAFLASQEGQIEVLNQAVQLQESGISGVPFFIFNRTLAVSGAQAPDVFASAIRQAMGSR